MLNLEKLAHAWADRRLSAEVDLLRADAERWRTMANKLGIALESGAVTGDFGDFWDPSHPLQQWERIADPPPDLVPGLSPPHVSARLVSAEMPRPARELTSPRHR